MQTSRLVLPLLFLVAACSAGVDDESTTGTTSPSGTTGSTNATTGQGGAGASAGVGVGGEGAGGMEGPCGMDCSTIPTEQCYEAICNMGEAPGPIGSCVVVPGPAGETCDDGLFCTVDEVCDGAGVCGGGDPNDCGMDGTACTEIVCDENDQQCNEEPLMNGTDCTSSDLCQTGTTCTNGVCGGGQAEDCFLEPVPNECYNSVCNPATGMCDPQPGNDGMACTDLADLCTEGKTCNAGSCVGGMPKDCTGLSQAAGCLDGVCDTATGQCTTQPKMPGDSCNASGDACNTGTCDANSNCIPMPVPDGTACTDFNLCTNGNTCQSGICGTLDPMCAVLLDEDFETCPPPGWTLGNAWECGMPGSSGPSTAATGTGIAGTGLNAAYANNLAYNAAFIETPPVDLTTTLQPELSWQDWVHTEGSSFDGYNIQYSVDSGTTFQVLTTVSPAYNLSSVGGQPAYGGNQSTQGWTPHSADLTALASESAVIFRFAVRTDGSVTNPGVFIDDVLIQDTAGPNAPISIDSAAVADVFVGATLSQPLLRTGGSAAATWSIEAGGVNDSWLSIDPMTGVLSGTPAAGNLGPATVIIRLAEPSVPTNFDEVTYDFEVVSSPYVEDFESCATLGWDLNASWECGAPTSGPAAAFGGANVLATNLAADYANGLAWNTNVANGRPLALPNLATLGLEFRVWFDTEGSSFDGWNIKVSTDGGATFSLLSAVTPVYNLNSVDGQTAWGGDQSSMGYQLYSADLSAFAGQTIILQFAMRTDGSVQNPGVYIDDVTIF